MLQIEYKLEENDFLEFQLFAAEKSELIVKKKRNSWLILSIASLAVTVFYIIEANNSLAIYFGVITVLILLFYPKYINWKYKRHYINHIRENYSARFGEIEQLEFHDDHLFAKDKTGEGTINNSEIVCVDETVNHFFIKVSTGVSLIIPKQELNNQNEIRNEFERLGIMINDYPNWIAK